MNLLKTPRQKTKRGKSCWLFAIFGVLLLYPIAGGKLDTYFTLNGVSTQAEKPELSLKAIMDGTYQEHMNAYLLENISGRNLLVRIHSQLLYSVFHTSSNNNIVIGSNEQLFEPEYLAYSLNIWGQPSEEEISGLVNKLLALNSALEADGKQLYIFITPSKARYYADNAPLSYKLCANTGATEVAYDKFIRGLDGSGLKVFDSIAYINEHRTEFEFPLWYSTGIHWSRALGARIGEAFNQYLKETCGYNLGQIHVTQSKTRELIAPDADLYNILNLLVPPSEEYYSPQITSEEGTDKPNVFFRGGSFMGQSLSNLVRNNIFNKDISFENNYYFTDNYSGGGTLSDFNAYDELDIPLYLEQSDLLILEVNENKIFTMSWGFIDYVLNYYENKKGE